MPIQVDRIRLEPILKTMSCTIQDHQLTLLIGASGSGKSTLLRSLAGLVNIDSGSISYDHIPLRINGKVNREVLLRHAIAFQFPEHQLFAQTVQGEFDYTLRPYRVSKEERTRRTLAAIKEMLLPPSILDESPFELSGGQKRSVVLATLLASRTDWLFLDEPSAGLDAKASVSLRERLMEWRNRKSIVMATHDWEFFLPIADRVLLLAEGELLADLTAEELAAKPNLLLQAGVGMPDAIKVASELRKIGISAPMKLLSPEEMAEAIIHHHGREHESLQSGTKETTTRDDFKSKVNASDRPIPGKRRIYRIEARLKWLIYILVSVFILWQRQWPGIAASFIVTFAALLLLRREHIRQALRLARPLLLFIVITAVISAIRVSLGNPFRLGLDVPDMLYTVRSMLPFFAMTLVGFVFSLSTSTTEMKTGLEKGLAIFKRFGVPTDMLALAASLVLRFIPMILAETDRFSAIAAARGKRTVKQGHIRMRDIPVFAIPLLISLFQMVEDFIIAMEIKGVLNRKTEHAGPHRPT